MKVKGDENPGRFLNFSKKEQRSLILHTLLNFILNTDASDPYVITQTVLYVIIWLIPLPNVGLCLNAHFIRKAMPNHPIEIALSLSKPLLPSLICLYDTYYHLIHILFTVFSTFFKVNSMRVKPVLFTAVSPVLKQQQAYS